MIRIIKDNKVLGSNMSKDFESYQEGNKLTINGELYEIQETIKGYFFNEGETIAFETLTCSVKNI